MDQFIENLAARYFAEHRHLFEEGAVFSRFFHTEGSLTVENVYPCPAFGYLVYRVGDEERLSQRMRIHYLVSDLSAQSTASLWYSTEASLCGLVWPNVRRCADTPPLLAEFCASAAYWRPTRLVAASMWRSPRGHLTVGLGRRLDADHLALMARKIGQFHGCVLRHASGRSQLLTRERRSAPPLYSEARCRQVQPSLRRCLRPLLADERCAAVQRLAAGVERLAEGVAATSDCAPECRVLCHMNYSPASVFFRYEGADVVDALIGNWATAAYCSLGADLVLVLFVEAAAELRQRLVAAYYRELERFCPPAQLPRLEQVEVEVKRCVPIALVALGARLDRLMVAPSLSLRRDVSPHWNDQFVTDVLRSLILDGYV